MLDNINERISEISLEQFSQSKIKQAFHNLQLIKLAAFENNQLNGIFNDNTTIILHPSFEFLTYFHSNNKKIRIKTENLIKNNNIHLKLHLMLNIFNLFSNVGNFPNSEIFLKLYFQTIKLSGEESELIFFSKDMIEKAYWIYEDCFFEQDLQRGYFLITSVDENIKFYLFKNLRIIKIEYPHILHTREAEVEGNFIYIKTVKFFSTKSLPANWRIPLQLLIKYFNIRLFNNSRDEFFYQEISSEFTIRKSKEYFNFLIANSLQGINRVNETSQESSLIKLVDDEINPIAFVFNSESKLKFLYTRNSTYLIIHDIYGYDGDGCDECEIINNENPQLISFTTNSISILSYQHDLSDEAVYSVEIGKYLQLLNEYRNEKKIIDSKFHSDFVNEMIYELSEINKNLDNGIICKFKGIRKNLKEIKEINNAKSKNLSFNFDGDDLLHYKIIKDLGEFLAFKNKAVKVKFYDRTILKIDSRREFCWAMNKYGQASFFNFDTLNGMDSEFIFYLENSMKFYNYCFQSSSEKRIINEKLKLYDEMSESSLKKINAMKIICGNEFNKSNIKNNKKIINNFESENLSDQNFSNQVNIEE